MKAWDHPREGSWADRRRAGVPSSLLVQEIG